MAWDYRRGATRSVYTRLSTAIRMQLLTERGPRIGPARAVVHSCPASLERSGASRAVPQPCPWPRRIRGAAAALRRIAACAGRFLTMPAEHCPVREWLLVPVDGIVRVDAVVDSTSPSALEHDGAHGARPIQLLEPLQQGRSGSELCAPRLAVPTELIRGEKGELGEGSSLDGSPIYVGRFELGTCGRTTPLLSETCTIAIGHRT